MPDPESFGEEPQLPLGVDDDDESWDEAIWGPKTVLTAEEQAAYDAWFLRKVQEGVDYAHSPDAIFHTQEDVEAMMEELIARLDREAGLK